MVNVREFLISGSKSRIPTSPERKFPYFSREICMWPLLKKKKNANTNTGRPESSRPRPIELTTPTPVMKTRLSAAPDDGDVDDGRSDGDETLDTADI